MGCQLIVRSFQTNTLHVRVLSDGWDTLYLPSTRTTWPEEDASQPLDLPMGCLWEEVWRLILVKVQKKKKNQRKKNLVRQNAGTALLRASLNTHCNIKEGKPEGKPFFYKRGNGRKEDDA